MCAVRRIELLQDVADVHLDRAFLHVQPGGDQLIGLTLAQQIDYRKLTWREVPSVRSPLPFTFRLVIWFCGCRAQRTRRNKRATGADKPERSHRNPAFDRCRHVPAHATRCDNLPNPSSLWLFEDDAAVGKRDPMVLVVMAPAG